MASGDLLAHFIPAMSQPPASLYAPCLVNTVARIPYLAYDDTTDWKTKFQGNMPSHYAGGSVKASIYFAMASAVTGKVRFDGYFARASSGANVNSLSWSAAQTVNVSAVPVSAGNIYQADITFTAGAQISSIQAGHPFFFRLERKPSDATNDTATGNAEVYDAKLTEA